MRITQPNLLLFDETTAWQEKHAKFVWTRYATIFLGLWLIINIPTFGLHSIEMGWSDGISGIALIIFALFSLSSKHVWAPWAICLTGIWLQLAPLVFWAPTAFNYVNDTLVGVIAIALSILIPGTPGNFEDAGPETPLGWSYNPSAWIQRLPIITLTCICWFASRYMAAFQLGYIHTMWDPVFGDGTFNVITSSVSKAFPVSDAGLGAVVYTIEALMGAKGGTSRWRTMPWIVALFGLLVVPAGLVSIVLIMLQPLLVGSWCFWCLLTAACMLCMIALTLDEVIATIQYLRESVIHGQPLWKTFWQGGLPIEKSEFDTQSPLLSQPAWSFFKAGFKGVSITWNLMLSLALGLWLLFLNGPQHLAVNMAHILGALTVTFSIIAMAEVTRTARYVNIVLGLFCIIIAFIMHAPSLIMWKASITGILLMGLNIPKGKIKENYGAWQRSIR